MSEKVDNTKDTAINKARLAANIPLEFKTGQIIGNLSRVSGGASGTDDRGLAAVGDLLYGEMWLGQKLLEGVISPGARCPALCRQPQADTCIMAIAHTE